MADRTSLHREAARKIVDIREFRRSQIAIGVATVLGLLALVLGAVLLFSINDRQDQGIAQLTGSLATVCERTDTAQVPGQVAEDCDRAKQGLPPVVVEGVDGTDGVDGLPGRSGSQGLAGVPGVAGQPGTPGSPGTPGTNGTDGRNGVDGQSPPCLSTPAMCQGRDGTDGKNGTPAMTQVQTYPDGSEITCNRTGGPDTAPTYACSQTRSATTSPPATTPTPGPDPGIN